MHDTITPRTLTALGREIHETARSEDTAAHIRALTAALHAAAAYLPPQLAAAVLNGEDTTVEALDLWVAVIEHEGGSATYVEHTPEAAREALADWVADWWDHEADPSVSGPCPRPVTSTDVDHYFEAVASHESYTISAAVLYPRDQQPTQPKPMLGLHGCFETLTDVVRDVVEPALGDDAGLADSYAIAQECFAYRVATTDETGPDWARCGFYPVVDHAGFWSCVERHLAR